MQEWAIAADAAGMRLDLWLARHGGAGSRSRAAAWLERGKVFVDGQAAGPEDAARRLEAGVRLGVWIDRPGSARAADRAAHDRRQLLRVVAEDAAFIVADKPAGMLVEPLPGRSGAEVTLLDLVRHHLRHDPRGALHVVHRIDRDTSGLVLFARTAEARDALKEQFERRTPVRVYQTVVEGVVRPARGRWSDQLAWDAAQLRQRKAHATDAGGKEAVAEYRVMEQFALAALVQVSLVTGKRNQIRVQAGLRGHPLLGERQYRFGAPAPAPDLPNPGRQALHAWRLGFRHPSTGRPVMLAADLPEDLRRVLAALRSRR
ncbi:MAG: RluA family pseudouridine synthase [Vicinamibacterales bacterium]